MGARSEAKALEAINTIKEGFVDADVRYLFMDLMQLSTVIAAAKKICRYGSQTPLLWH
jgi:hypothetical protein